MSSHPAHPEHGRAGAHAFFSGEIDSTALTHARPRINMRIFVKPFMIAGLYPEEKILGNKCVIFFAAVRGLTLPQRYHTPVTPIECFSGGLTKYARWPIGSGASRLYFGLEMVLLECVGRPVKETN